MGNVSLSIKGGFMNYPTTRDRWRGFLFVVGTALTLAAGPIQAADETKGQPPERREEIALADAALRALKNNLDISISRQTKESRLTDIVVEQANFDPTL